MSEDKEKTSPKSHIRTFAMDLAIKRGQKEDKQDKVEKKEITEQKAKEEEEAKIDLPKAPKIDRSKLKPIPRTNDVVVPKKTSDPKFNIPKTTPESLAIPIPKPQQAIEVPKQKEKPDTPKKIPSFHELSKSKKKADTPKKDEDSEIKVTVNTKTKSGGLLQSIKSLFKIFNFKHKQSKAPTYTVPETSRRKGVIQEATSKTGAIFTADNESLKESIRRRQEREKIEEEKETVWSPYTETGYNLLESPEPIQPANVQVEFKNHIATQTPPQIVEEIPEAPELVESSTNEELPDKEVGKEVVLTNKEESQSTQTENESEEESNKQSEIPANDPVEQKATNTVEERSLIRRFASLNTNTQALSLLGLMAGVFAIFLITNFISSIFTVDEPGFVETTEIIISSAEQISIEITGEEGFNLTETVSNKVIGQPGKLAEIAVVDLQKNEVSVETLFKEIGLTPPPSLTKSVNTARFIANDTSRPAVIMLITDRENVYGDMLKWENEMSKEMSGLYSQTNTMNSDIRFIDKNISDIDTRILTNEYGEVIVYGIINNNVLLITENSASFSQISKEIVAQ